MKFRTGVRQRSVGLVVVVFVAAVALPASAVAKAGFGSKNQPSLTISGDFGYFCCTHPNSRTYTVTNEGGSASGALSVTLAFDATFPDQAFALTKDGCTGRSLGPAKTCLVELTWLAGGDTLVTLKVDGKRAAVSSPTILGFAVP